MDGGTDPTLVTNGNNVEKLDVKAESLLTKENGATAGDPIVPNGETNGETTSDNPSSEKELPKGPDDEKVNGVKPRLEEIPKAIEQKNGVQPESDEVTLKEDETVVVDGTLYRKLLERLETMDKKLEEYAHKPSRSSDSYSDVSKDDEAKDEEKEEEIKVDEPFSVENCIKYIPSELWMLKKFRPKWETETSEYSIVVSMKSTASAIHLLSDPNPWSANVKEDYDFDDEMTNRTPDRVAISCSSLLAEISRISGTNLETGVNVLIRPYKVLVAYRDEYVECLKEKQETCDKLKAEQKKLEEEYEAEKASSALGAETAKDEKASEKKDEKTDEKKDDKDDKKSGSESAKESKKGKLSKDKQNELKSAMKIANGMEALIHVIDKDLKDIMEIRHHIKDNTITEIAFENLWNLYKPGDLIVTSKPKPQAYRILNVGGGRSTREKHDMEGRLMINSSQKPLSDFFIDCFNIDFNGTHYGPSGKKLTIAPYEGLRPLSELDPLPINSLPESETSKIKEELLARGKKFVRLARVSHKKYKGLSVKEGSFRHEEIDSDIIVDFALAFKNNATRDEIEPPSFNGGVVEDPTTADGNETLEASQGCSIYDHCIVRYTYDDAEYDVTRRTAFKSGTNLMTVQSEEGRLGKERQMLLPHRVYGYVLLSRKWYPLDIDLVEDVKETQSDSPDGFSDLVLPEDHKQIVRALVKTHARGPRSTSDNKSEAPQRDIDLVKGKGRGLIILLHGVPGVGKTSTAECVALNTNRPLFPITCGDIGGTTAKDVENNLESYFDLARKWGCVLLLDEADVFLGERTKGDIVQNSLVSVFLRVLEYYSGILILTTNRVGQFDEAIKSRIHVSLYYPPLSRKSTLEIWNMNLDRLVRDSNTLPPNRPVIFSRKEIMNFAKGHWTDNEATKTHWNGRQIKNAFQTAIALAEWDYIESQTGKKGDTDSGGLLLEARHFKKVAEASARFDQYLAAVRKSDAYNAKDKRNRYDEFDDTGVPTESGLRYPTFEESKKAQRSRKATTPQPDSDSDVLKGSSDSSGDDTDEEVRVQRRQMEDMRWKKEEAQRKVDEAEKQAKKKAKEAKKKALREEEERKKRDQMKSKVIDSDSDST